MCINDDFSDDDSWEELHKLLTWRVDAAADDASLGFHSTPVMAKQHSPGTGGHRGSVFDFETLSPDNATPRNRTGTRP